MGNAIRASAGEHRRVKGTRNGPKIEKMGQRTKSTLPGLPHTGRPHDSVSLASLDHGLKQSQTGVTLLSPNLVQFGKGQF
ncbi:Phosphatidylethanolamine N-methyltransferase 1 [Gossypium arboreum]|uniref:Phosphatidylethanolamine N-methyltransferase 1 n=1 Tax=Gossypium arboreum TaxID=29729 RepID=A0A0B0N8D2_GOSAR|nr:Phosphatidylethanolamine N-methyltransferase 1 [Gossypium arboreum]